MNLRDTTLAQFLDQAASASPTPGGGAVAAVGGALGAAMVAMTARLTEGRPRYAAVQEQVVQLARAADAARAALLDLAEADAAAYGSVMAALRLPRDDDAQRALREVAVQQATIAATQVPAAIAEQCQAVVALAETAAAITNRNALGDVATGALLAEAGMRAAALQAELNLLTITDAEFTRSMGAALAPRSAGDAARLESILARVRERAAGGA